MGRLRDILIDLAVMAAIALALALLGPFGMFSLPFGVRLLYWLIVAVGGYVLYQPAMEWATRLAIRIELPMAAMWVATCLLISVPMTALIWFANGLLGQAGRFSLSGAIELYGNILIVAAIVCTVFWFASAKRRGEMMAVPQAAVPAPIAGAQHAPFLDRLPPQIGTELIALEMEDHYVRAHTSRGSALILLRLRDAIAELGVIEGEQVHRSWWVARDAVEKVERDGRNVRLELKGGLIAPVARNSVTELKSRGWL